MRFHTLLLLAAPLLSFAQAPHAAPPPDVDQALRTRVTAFLQFQQDGNFRKAYELVAEDSKDYYFSAPKQKSLSFTIDEIQYTGDFSAATVKAMVTQRMGLAGQQVDVPGVVTTQWKLEKGEWVWYHDASKDVLLTMVGPIPTGGALPPAAEPAKPSPLPKDLSPAAVAAAAAKLAPKETIDKRLITFTLGKEGTDVITFSNQNMGQVRVYVGVKGATDDVDVEPRDTMLNALAELPVKVTYKATKNVFPRTVVEFIVEPFDAVYDIPVRVVREGSVPKP